MTGNEIALIVWACAAGIGVPTTIALSLHWNEEFTLMDLIAAVIAGSLWGPLIPLAWAANRVVLRKKP